ncbi:MAG TPA: VCBS repeat-containing protein [candidate division Zixibacteria bacterium]|nr:VCBS repeat-containing protein [candidate division Zixibacteria bacterium]
MNSYGIMSRLHRFLRLKNNNRIGFLGTAVLLFSIAAAQNVTKYQSDTRKTEKRAERLKASTRSLRVEKKLFFQKTLLGTVTAVRQVPGQQDSQPFFWVAGERGGALVTGAGRAQHAVTFEHQGGKIVPIDLDGDSSFEFISYGWGQDEIRLFDSNGRERWKYGLGTNPAASDAACGDLDGDGLLECAVGMKGDGGIRLLDRNGKELWRRPDLNVWQVEILDWDGNGKNEILHTNAAGRVRIRDAEGDILRELPGKNFISLFSICRWQNPDSGWFILNNNNRIGIQVIDFEGNIVASIPSTVKGYEAVGTPVRLEAGKPPYFAMLVCKCVPRRDSRLFLYDPEGEIIYEESFIPSQAALLTIRTETSGQEALLVGEADGTVWQYRLAPTTPRK